MKIFCYILCVSCLVFSASVGTAAEKVIIASIFEKSGPGAPDNRATIEGIRFAVAALNQRGGLLGNQVTLLELDNQSTALHAKLAAETAVKAGVIAVFGANWSSNSLAMAPVLQAARIPMISPFSTNPDVTKVGDYIFRVCFTDSFQGPVMAQFALQGLKAKTAGILINANSRYSEGLAEFFNQSFKKQGGKILFEADYLQDTNDFTPYILKLKRLHPDVVFVPGHNADSVRIIKQAREAGLLIPFLGGDGWGNEMYDSGGSAIEGNFYSGHWHKDIENKKSRLFAEKYEKKYGKIENSGPALAHDVVFLFADAVRRAGSLRPAKIRDALAATCNFNGITGNISFNANGDPIKPVVILEFDQGTSVYVKTIAPEQSPDQQCSPKTEAFHLPSGRIP